MPSTHVLTAPAPRSTPRPVPVSLPSSRRPALPSLTRRPAPSVGSALILALVVLALLLQASFLVGLATGSVAGPELRPAARALAAAR